MEADVGGADGRGKRDPEPVVALERGHRHDLDPVRLVAGNILLADAGLERGGGREIAGEMPGVDLEAMNLGQAGQADDAEIMPRTAPPARLPAVHPLAVRVVLAGDEDRIGGRDEPLLGGEEVVGCEDDPGAEPRLREIDRPWGAGRGCHGVVAAKSFSSRPAAILWISAMAVANSISGAFLIRSRKAASSSSGPRPATAITKGKPKRALYS